MQTPMQLTIRSLTLTIVSMVIILGMNIAPASDMQTFVLALDDESANTTKIEYTGTPGETIKGQIVIQNPSANPKNIQITLENLDEDDVRENGLATTANLYECCKDWVVLPQGEFYTIEPNKKTVIPYEMNIPADAEAKNYYGAFIVKEVNGAAEINNSADNTEGQAAAAETISKKHHCNIVKLRILHAFDPNLGMLTAAGTYDGAREINMYSPVFVVLAALMLAVGIALGARWCIKNYAPKK